MQGCLGFCIATASLPHSPQLHGHGGDGLGRLKRASPLLDLRLTFEPGGSCDGLGTRTTERLVESNL